MGHGVETTEPSCFPARLDDDPDLDADDLSIFLGCMSGANVYADPNCAELEQQPMLAIASSTDSLVF